MERLTFEGNFCDIAQCRELPCPYDGSCTQKEVWGRLKAYEDTGWTPEMLHKLGENAWHLWDFAQAAENMTVGRLKELAEADKDGRVVVLPCKVGERSMGNINCLQCEFRHPDNGNCTKVGGFCTAVPAAHCPLLRQYLGTRMTPEQVANAKTIIESAFAEDTSKAERIRKLLAADKEGRCIILP